MISPVPGLPHFPGTGLKRAPNAASSSWNTSAGLATGARHPCLVVVANFPRSNIENTHFKEQNMGYLTTYANFRYTFMTRKRLKWCVPFSFFAVTLGFALLYYWSAPVADHWYIVKLFTKLRDGHLVPVDLFKLHGVHWHASGYVVQLALAEMSAMAHWVECLGSVLFAGLGFIAIARMLDCCIDQLRAWPAILWVYGLSAFLYFSLDQSTNWLWGWQVAVFISNAGALWTIERLTRGVPTLLNTTLAAIAAAVSVYGFGTGWVLIPIGYALLLLFGALRSREGMSCMALWTALSALLLYHFFSMLTSKKSAYIEKGTPDLYDSATYAGLVHFTVNFVASPLVGNTMRDIYITIPVILTGVIILIWSLWILRRDKQTNVLLNVSPFLALVAFAFGAGLLTALGRWEMFGTNQAFVDRLVSFGTFFWIGVFVLASLAVVKQGGMSNRRILGVLGLFLLLKLSNIPGEVQKKVEHSFAVREAAKVLSENYPDVSPTEYSILYAPEQRAKVEEYLRTLWVHKVSVFARNREEQE